VTNDESGDGSVGLPVELPFFYGWVIVVVSALILFFSGPGQTYSVSVFVDSYVGEFGWSRSAVSGMYSVGTLLAGLCMGFVGGLLDRVGYRRMTPIITVLLGFACLWLSFVDSLLMLVVGFFFVRLLGQGSMSLSGSTLVVRWFVRRRGRVLSLVSLGAVASATLLPPLNTWIIQGFGWRVGWRVWAVLLWCVMAPVAYLFTRDQPEDVGLYPDGEKIKGGVVEDAVRRGKGEPWSVGEAVRTRSFWLVCFCLAVPSAVLTALLFHQVSVMGQVGLSPGAAAVVLSVMAVVNVPVSFAAGVIADRVPVRYLLAGMLGLLFAGVVVLQNADSLFLALVYGCVVGAVMGIQRIASGVVWPDYFGRRHLGSVQGVATMTSVVASAFGPLPFGFAYDMFGSYQQALVMSLVVSVLGVVAALLATPPRVRG
jgi:MFS family permease